MMIRVFSTKLSRDDDLLIKYSSPGFAIASGAPCPHPPCGRAPMHTRHAYADSILTWVRVR